MIELAIRPDARVMAQFTTRRESRADVIHRTFGIVVVRLVAIDTCGIRQLVVVIGVAVCALSWRYKMRPGQGEPGLGMIEACAIPRACTVTTLAGLGESGRYVVGILGSLVIL